MSSNQMVQEPNHGARRTPAVHWLRPMFRHPRPRLLAPRVRLLLDLLGPWMELSVKIRWVVWGRGGYLGTPSILSQKGREKWMLIKKPIQQCLPQGRLPGVRFKYEGNCLVRWNPCCQIGFWKKKWIYISTSGVGPHAAWPSSSGIFRLSGW